ncbi:Hypothetical_protein [Hexamita inflata]|uniref:Hypothetical_protein n=1 Tax=Hexamita inflata TaxID=28002 RepID=A0AA86P4Q4_9EUKA|nr:Hypothetical protein HINF_LOCUS19025 [Hexamita inflata]
MKINLTKYEIKATPRKIEGCNQPVSPIKEPVIEAYKHYHVYTKVSAQCVGCKQCNSRYVCSCKGYHLCPECYKTHISEQNDIRGYTHIYKNEQSDLKYEQYVLIYIEHENSNLPIKWLKSISRILLIICEVEILTSLTLFRFNKINNIKQTSQLNQSSTAYLLKQLFNQNTCISFASKQIQNYDFILLQNVPQKANLLLIAPLILSLQQNKIIQLKEWMCNPIIPQYELSQEKFVSRVVSAPETSDETDNGEFHVPHCVTPRHHSQIAQSKLVQSLFPLTEIDVESDLISFLCNASQQDSFDEISSFQTYNSFDLK